MQKIGVDTNAYQLQFQNGPSVHNGFNPNEIIPAAGTHIPHFFIGTFDFLKAILYNGLKGGQMI
jgi:hypothetical protein